MSASSALTEPTSGRSDSSTGFASVPLGVPHTSAGSVSTVLVHNELSGSVVSGPAPLHVPRFSERTETGKTSTPSAAPSARPSGNPPQRGRWWVSLGLLCGFAALSYGVWNSLFRYTAYGIVQAHVVVVPAPCAGTVSALLATPGQDVFAGQPLLRLECVDAEDKLQRAQENLAAAQAMLASETARGARQAFADQAGRLQAQADYLKALGQLKNEQAELEARERQLQRIQGLAERGAATEVEVEQATLLASGQKAELKLLQQSLAELERRCQQPLPTEAMQRQLLLPFEQRVTAALAEVARCQAELDRTIIKAPVDGRLLKYESLLGDSVTQEQSVLLLQQAETTELAIYIPQRSINHWQVGKQVEVEMSPSAVAWRCEVTRVGTQYQQAPLALERLYRAQEPLLPIYLKPVSDAGLPFSANLGSVVAIPRLAGWLPAVTASVSESGERAQKPVVSAAIQSAEHPLTTVALPTSRHALPQD